MSPMTTAIMGTVPAARAGMASATSNTLRQVGSVFGIAVLGNLLTRPLHRPPEHALRPLICRPPSPTPSWPRSGRAARRRRPSATRCGRRRHQAHDRPPPFTSGMHLALWVSGLMLLAGAPIALPDPRHGAAPRRGAPGGGRRRAAEPSAPLAPSRRGGVVTPGPAPPARRRRHVCSAEHAGWLSTPLRRLLHDPRRILAGLVRAATPSSISAADRASSPCPGRDGRARAAASSPSTCSRRCSSRLRQRAERAGPCRAHPPAPLRGRHARELPRPTPPWPSTWSTRCPTWRASSGGRTAR